MELYIYYPGSENKGTDKLCGHREADLRLCFRIYKKRVFSQRGSFNKPTNQVEMVAMTKELLRQNCINQQS